MTAVIGLLQAKAGRRARLPKRLTKDGHEDGIRSQSAAKHSGMRAHRRIITPGNALALKHVKIRRSRYQALTVSKSVTTDDVLKGVTAHYLDVASKDASPAGIYLIAASSAATNNVNNASLCKYLTCVTGPRRPSPPPRIFRNPVITIRMIRSWRQSLRELLLAHSGGAPPDALW